MPQVPAQHDAPPSRLVKFSPEMASCLDRLTELEASAEALDSYMKRQRSQPRALHPSLLGDRLD